METGTASTYGSVYSLFRQFAEVSEVVSLRVGAGDRLGRYQLIAELGRGGFGVVFEARDLELPRSVAIKLLRPNRRGSEEAVRQFQREAEAVAGLNHSRIVTIHDFGSNGEVDFLVLELLRGETLATRLSRSPLEVRAALDFAIAIAEGVACAHAAGVVHRDLKPSNVFLTLDDGLKLVDFGLARSESDATTELAGAGTPAYMAPEQRRDQPGDTRSDVYSLGIILFEMLSGRRPPADGQADAAIDVAQLDAPSVVREVCARALAPDPNARYADGAAMLEALRGAQRGIERQRRARWLSLGGTVLVVLGALGLGVWLRARHRETTRVRLAAEVAVEVRDLEAQLRYAHLQPLHDVEPDQAQVRAQMRRLQEKLDGLGDFGEGAGELALGRGYLALHDAANAELHLEAAERLGYRGPEVTEALGVALGERYRNEVVAADRIKDPEERAAARSLLQTRYRAPGLALLHASKSSSAYALALIALYEQRFDDALALAERAFQQSTWLYESLALSGEVHVERARANQERGQFREALAENAAARASYERALAIGRSDPVLLRAELARANQELTLCFSVGRTGATAFAAAKADAEKALRAAPNDVATLIEAVASPSQYSLERPAGEETALAAQAQALADRAVALAPDNAEALETAAHVHARRFVGLVYRGVDATGELQLATRDFERAIAKGGDEKVAVDFAEMLISQGDTEADHGADPTPALERALSVLERAHSGTAAKQRGRALTALAQCQGRHGIDPHPTFARAAAAFAESNRLRPNHPDTADLEGGNYFALGVYDRQHGVDAAETFRKSIERSERALTLKPSWPSGNTNLGTTLVEAAANEAGLERDPLPLLARARASFERSAALDPDSIDIYYNLALARMNESSWLLDHELDAAAPIEAGLAAVKKLMAMTHNDYTNEGMVADLLHCAGRQEALHHRSPLAAYGRALAANQIMKAHDTKNPAPHAAAAGILRHQVEWKLAAGRPVAADLAQAESEAAECLRIEPDNAEWLVLKARLLALHARSLSSHGSGDERRARARAAVELFRRIKPSPARPTLAAEAAAAARLAE